MKYRFRKEYFLLNLFLTVCLFLTCEIGFTDSPEVTPKVDQKEAKAELITTKSTPEDVLPPLEPSEKNTEVDSKLEDKKDRLPGSTIKLELPTDNREIFGDPTKFYMYTNRYIDGINLKPWQGGKYGYVRNRLYTQIGVLYTRLHEGIDIRPLKRDSQNIPLDDVRTMAEGTVVYVNTSSSRSNYGKYVVVKHEWPEGPFYSLYAHLASTVVEIDAEVKTGDVLGRLGYTGAGIDRDRAHVHVELNFMASERFCTDYSAGNGHKNYNGLNLVGIDLARFLKEQKENPYLTMKQFLATEIPYYKVRTSVQEMPGILKRHPWLGRQLDKTESAKSWEFTFARSGVPLAITPSEIPQKFPVVTWVKEVKTNHSYLTMGRLSGHGSKASLSSRGGRYITLISEAF